MASGLGILAYKQSVLMLLLLVVPCAVSSIITIPDAFSIGQQPLSRRATDCVRADLPERPVELAQPLRIPLKLSGPRVTAIYVTEADATGILENRQGHTRIGNGPAKVVAQDGTSKTIEIIPLQVGNLHLETTVEFSDGAEEIESYTIKVVPTSTGLKKFTLHQGLSVLMLNSGAKSQTKTRFLEPEAYYDNLDYPIQLPPNLSAVQISVKQSEEDPVISIDGEGKIHALRKGRATITGHFGGMADRVAAIVE